MVRTIVDEEMALTHGVLGARRGKLVVEEGPISGAQTLALPFFSGHRRTPTGIPERRKSPCQTS